MNQYKKYLDKFKKLPLAAQMSLLIIAFLLFTLGITINNTPQRQEKITRADSSTLSVSTQGLIAFYSFNEAIGTTIYNSSSNNTATLVNGTAWTTGQSGSALQFDGVDDYADMGTSSNLNFEKGDFSYSFWVNVNSDQKNKHIISKWKWQNTPRSNRGIIFTVQEGPWLQVWLGDSSSSQYIGSPSSSPLPLNTWKNIALTRELGKVRLYIDGIEVASRNLSYNINTSTPLIIGGPSDLSPKFFNGKIDELKIYNRALSPQEISTNYQLDLPTPTPEPTSTPIPTPTIAPDITPPSISIISPVNNKAFTTSSITVSGTASDDVLLSKVEVKLNSDSYQIASGTASWSKKATLSQGINTIYAKATDTSGNTNETSVTVTLGNSVVINADRTISINGKKTFPVSMWSMCKAGDLNCDVSVNKEFTYSSTRFQPISIFENAKIFWTYDAASAGGPNFPEALKYRPYFLGYMQVDEPNGTSTGQTIADVEAAYNKAKTFDQNHPVILNHYINASVWLPYTDIITWDMYPFRDDLGWNKGYFSRSDAMYAWEYYSYTGFLKTGTISSLGKPVWAVLQANGLPYINGGGNILVPTTQEARANTYTAITTDVKGVGYFGYEVRDSANPGLALGLVSNSTLHAYYRQLAKEITGLNDILVLPTKDYSWGCYYDAAATDKTSCYKEGKSVTFSKNLTRTILWKDRYNFNYMLKQDTATGKTYLIVVNKDPRPIYDVDITVSGLTAATMTAKTLGLTEAGSTPGRVLTVTNGKFTDSFEGYAVNIYEIAASEISPTPLSTNLPFKRMMFVSNRDTNGFKTTADIDSVINNLSYMNADAILANIGSEYFEAVRDPTGTYLDGRLKKDVDQRASWNMLEYIIEKAHDKNIKVYVWTPILHQAKYRAEDKLFGTQFRVIRRNTSVTPNTYYQDTDRYANDVGFKTLADYEIGYITFIAKHYPNLDGVHIEEPYYPWDESYSQPVIDKYIQKYGSNPKSGAETSTVKTRIQGIMREYLNNFFTRLKASVNTNKANPNFTLSANGAHYYEPLSGLDPKFMSRNNLLDWYVGQINGGDTLSGYTSAVNSFKTLITEIPIIPKADIAYGKTCDSNNVCTPNVNPAIIDQIKATCQYGGDAEGIYGYQYRNLILNGTAVSQRLHDTPPSALCKGGSVMISGTAAAYWEFKEASGTNTADSSGNGNTGTLINGPVWTTGYSSSALQFDGVNDYVQISDSASLDITDAITIEAWVYPEAWTNYAARIVSKESTTFADPYALEGLDSRLKLFLKVGSSSNESLAAQSASLPPLNQWTHVAAVWNGSAGKIYFNGVQNGTDVSLTGKMPVTTTKVLIGNNPTNARQFNGLIDEVKIYNKALTSSEVLADYNLGLTPSPSPR